MTSISEQPERAPAIATSEPKPTRKPNGGKRARHVASSKARAGKKASPAKKAPKSATKPNVRAGSKTAEILDRPDSQALRNVVALRPQCPSEKVCPAARVQTACGEALGSDL